MHAKELDRAIHSLHKYFIWANAMRTHFYELVPRIKRDERFSGEAIKADMYMSLWCAAEDAPAQRELRTYPLHGNAISADISPDEMLVATLLSRSEPTDDPSNIKSIDLLQLWDFRQDKLCSLITLDQTTQHKTVRRTGV